MKRTEPQGWPARLGGYLLIPHELLHLLGFRLVGKRCRYQWGQGYVTPIGPMSPWQQLIGRLLPFVVFTLAFIVCAVCAGLAYNRAGPGGSPGWFIFWLILMQVAAVYAGTTLVDLRRAYLLILNKPWHSWTPLDIFFWPVVDWAAVRKSSPLEESDAEES